MMGTRILTTAGVLVKLKRRLNGSTQRRVAKDMGVSPQQLNDVLHSRVQPPRKILTALGLERVTFYRPLS